MYSDLKVRGERDRPLGRLSRLHFKGREKSSRSCTQASRQLPISLRSISRRFSYVSERFGSTMALVLTNVSSGSRDTGHGHTQHLIVTANGTGAFSSS